MTIYRWRSETSGQEITVIRKVEEYTRPPEDSESDGDEGPWTRLVTASVIDRTDQFGKKGEW